MTQEGINMSRLEEMMLALMESNKKITDQQAQIEARLLQMEKDKQSKDKQSENKQSGHKQLVIGGGESKTEKGEGSFVLSDDDELIGKKVGIDKKTSKEVIDLTEKFEKMQTVLKQSHGMEDYLFDIDALCSHPKVALPAKFKLNDVSKFDGTGDPKAHLRQYVSSMMLKGLTREHLPIAFSMTLTGAASTWYHSQDSNKFKVWEETAREFMKQYAYNLQLDVTIRDLETTRHEETFSEFLQRWKAKAVNMTSRPSEDDQVRMIMKNLQPAYFKYLFSIPISTFDQLRRVDTQIEDAILDGKIEKEDIKTWRKGGNSGGGSNNNGGNQVAHVDAQVNALNAKQFPTRQTPRAYTELGMSLSTALEKLTKGGMLKPLNQ